MSGRCEGMGRTGGCGDVDDALACLGRGTHCAWLPPSRAGSIGGACSTSRAQSCSTTTRGRSGEWGTTCSGEPVGKVCACTNLTRRNAPQPLFGALAPPSSSWAHPHPYPRPSCSKKEAAPSTPAAVPAAAAPTPPPATRSARKSTAVTSAGQQ